MSRYDLKKEIVWTKEILTCNDYNSCWCQTSKKSVLQSFGGSDDSIHIRFIIHTMSDEVCIRIYITYFAPSLSIHYIIHLFFQLTEDAEWSKPQYFYYAIAFFLAFCWGQTKMCTQLKCVDGEQLALVFDSHFKIEYVAKRLWTGSAVKRASIQTGMVCDRQRHTWNYSKKREKLYFMISIVAHFLWTQSR